MPSNDLISRKYIIKELLKEREKFPAMVEERYSFGVKIPRKFNQALRGGIRKALRIAETAPAVDAEPVRHAKWITDDLGNTFCTACKGRIPYYKEYDMDDDDGYYDVEIDETNYCPNCGAKMET